jgi:hypothetical protein
MIPFFRETRVHDLNLLEIPRHCTQVYAVTLTMYLQIQQLDHGILFKGIQENRKL